MKSIFLVIFAVVFLAVCYSDEDAAAVQDQGCSGNRTQGVVNACDPRCDTGNKEPKGCRQNSYAYTGCACKPGFISVDDNRIRVAKCVKPGDC